MAFEDGDTVVVGTLVNPRIDHVLESSPGIYVHAFSVAVDHRIAGSPVPSTVFATYHSGTDTKPFMAGTKVIVSLQHIEGTLPSPSERYDARRVQPWSAGLESALTSSVAPDGLRLSIAQVPPSRPSRWQNDFGDGEFDLTLRNTTSSPVLVPGVFVVGGAVQWDHAIVVRDEDHRSLTLTKQPLADGATPFVLPPGASITRRVDVKPFGLLHPMGGYSTYYSFRVGPLRTSSWFYYHQLLHGPLMGKR